jgi:gliding motility-associated-like protein
MKSLKLCYTLLIFLGILIFPKAQCDNVTPSFSSTSLIFCGPGPHVLSFTNTSTGANSSAATYEWDVDGIVFDNTTGLTSPDNAVISGVGIHTINLTVSDFPPPCSEVYTLEVVVEPSPESNFTFSPDAACAGLIVDFSNTSTGVNGGTNYSWDFGDGSTSNEENPQYSFGSGGTYTVTLTVENFPGCSSSSNTTVTALDIPHVAIAGDDGDGNTINCLLPGDPTTTQTVDFFNFTTGAISYEWDFGDGTTSTESEPSHLYDEYGTYTVTMTATGPNGCTATTSLTVVFERFVSASMTLDITEYSGCTPHNLSTLQNLSVNANTYVWDFGDGSTPYFTSDQTPPNHIYTEPGTYTISLTASNSCNSANATISPITIVGPPQANFTPSMTAGCAPANISFTNNSTGASPANNYQWDMGNGNTYTNTFNPPAQTYDDAGTYTVTLTAGNACGINEVTQSIVLDTIPIASIDADPIEDCSPMTVTFENFSQGNITLYQWFLDGVLYSNDSIIAPITFVEDPGNTPVNHQVVLVVSNPCGQTSDTVDIIVHRPTLAAFTVSDTEVCLGTAITINNNSLGENLTYEWDFGDGTNSTDPGPHSIDYASPGTYTIQLIATGFCGIDVHEIEVTVNPITEADFTILEPIDDCSPMTISPVNNSSGVGLTHQWLLDGALIHTGENPGAIEFIIPPGNDPVEYLLELTVTSACGTETVNETIIVHPPTLANFSVDPIAVCLGDEIVVTDNSLGENLEWEWDFGDGLTATSQGPHSIIYSTPGVYSIELVAEGFCGPDTMSVEVEVFPYPIAEIIPNPIDGCTPLEVTFINNSLGADTYQWNFGPNASSTSSSDFDPGVIVYSIPGNEMIVLSVEANGCEDSDTVYVDIYPLPVLDFELIPDTGCSPLNVSIINNSIDNGSETFTWDFGNGNTFLGYNPSNQNYTATGVSEVYNITLTVNSGDGCIDSLTQQVNIDPLPAADFSIETEICANELMNTQNLSQGGSTYFWDFGDGNTSNDFSPTHLFASSGIYEVKLVVSTAFGCLDSITQTINVLDVPVPAFSNTTECLGFITEFEDESAGNPTSWDWDFGDGNNSSVQNPQHLYNTAGSFNVTLIVENSLGCSEAVTQAVLVNTIPIPDFDASDFCLGDETSFSNTTQGVTIDQLWDFGDSNTSNDVNPTHTYGVTGTFEVTLIAYGGSGCSDTIIQSITITEVPISDFSVIQACENDTTFFTDLSQGNPDTFFWDFGDGNTSTEQFPNHVYSNAGTYAVSLTTSYLASGCNHTITITVESYPRTLPDFDFNIPCLGAATQFNDLTGNDPILWNWDFGDGNNSFDQNPAHIYGIPGLFDVSLIAENVFGCIDTIQQQVEVFPLPTAGFEADTVCLNATTSFSDLSSDAVEWEYFFGDGIGISTTANPNYLYANDGIYNVIQVVTNSLGCTDTSTVDIIVHPNPVADFVADTVCFSYATAFTDLSIDAIGWSWDFDDNLASSTLQNPNHIFSDDGIYTIQLIVENQFGCFDNIAQNIEVLPRPIAQFTNSTVCAGNDVIFENNSFGNPNEFSWDFGDGSNVVNDENPIHSYVTGGLYTIEFIVGNTAGCADTLLQEIEVFTVPFPDFVADTVCLFSVTSFTNLTVDPTPINDWYWDFGDGNNSFAESPNYIYQNPGTYQVTMTATNINGCDSTITQTVVVSDIPVANFDADAVCFGSPTTFTDLSTGNPTQWIWTFGDGNFVDGNAIEQHTYAAPGNYLVTLYVQGGSSTCSDQVSQIVNIIDEAQAGMLLPDEICDGLTVNFNDNSTTNFGAIDTYEWDMGDGTIYSTENGTHVYPEPGIYTVTLTVTTVDGCFNSTSQEIEVHPNPTADFSAGLACENQSTIFTDLSVGDIELWSWSFGDGNNSNQNNPTHNYSNTGNYNVGLTVTSIHGCQNTTNNTVTVLNTPIAGFSSTTVCYGDQTDFTDLSFVNNSTIVEWEWEFNLGEGNSSIQNPSYTFEEYTDQFEVSLVVTASNGCTDTIIQNVSLHPIVIFDFDANRMTGCEPMEVVFSDNSFTTDQNGFIVNYTWDFGDGITSFNQNPVHIYADAGEYTVTLTVVTNTDCMYTDTLGYQIIVYPMPVAGFLATPTVTSITEPTIEITDLSVDANNYEYYFDNNYYSNDPEPTVIYDEPGTYIIMQIVQSIHNCIDTAYQAVQINSELLFYVPNSFTPNDDGRNDIFRWSVVDAQSFEIIIFNRWGEQVYQTTDPEAYWDGKYAGQVVKDGVYVWKAFITDMNDEEHVRVGHVTIVR